MTRPIYALLVGALLVTSCTATRAAAPAECDGLDAQFASANALWKASHFKEASHAFEQFAAVNDRCSRMTIGLTQDVRYNIASDYLSAGETAHQAGDASRSVHFVQLGLKSLLMLAHEKNLSETLRDELGDSIKQAQSDLKGVWTEQGRLE